MAKRGRPQKKITIEDITREITENGLTIKQVAAKYQVSDDTVQRRMKAASKVGAKSSRRKGQQLEFCAGLAPGVTVQTYDVLVPQAAPEFLAPAPDDDGLQINGKKVGEFEWREWAEWAKKGQDLKAKASWSQPGLESTFTLGDGSSPIILATFSDQHIGSWGCDYGLFCEVTREIVETPNLYMVMLGDETEHAIKLRNVLEVTSQIFTPEIQEQFIESWLKEVDDKIAWAGWSNHGIERGEKQAGSSVLKNLLSRHAAYFNGLAHVTVKVGDQEYKVASNHKFRGNSMYSRVQGPKRYVRMEAPDRDIVLQGDLHTPEMDVYHEGGMQHVAITTGTLHLNSGYARRYFSLLTTPAYPCIVLDNKQHRVTPFWTIQEALQFLS